jgi:uncharacterized linocin/CFP29 family protein
MTQSDPQGPWTDEQWARVNLVVQEEANRARVAATFLPLYGPLEADADFVRSEKIVTGGNELTIEDKAVIQLATLQVKVKLRGAQVADADLTSALHAFRRAANAIARLEDAIIFRGQKGADDGPDVPAAEKPPEFCKILGGEKRKGLFGANQRAQTEVSGTGNDLVEKVSETIGELEKSGHFGPFTVVLGQKLFSVAQKPEASLALPQDRIIPFLGGGALLRSSTLAPDAGLIVALGGAPVELVVAKDISVDFLQITDEPAFLFRVFEKIALRIKDELAIVSLRQTP